MKIGVKYCGGCNPRYDRVAMVNACRRNYPQWSVERAQPTGQEYILIVCGCTAACAAHSDLVALRKKIIIDSKERFLAACKEIEKENEVT